MIPVQREILPNGVTLLFVETHQAPVTSINICLRVGSRMETDAEAGICHLIEHMLFKGTNKLAPGDVARLIEAGGGSQPILVDGQGRFRTQQKLSRRNEQDRSPLGRQSG